MSKIFGYARVSSTDQSLDVQVAALEAAGCLAVFAEKISGKDTNRPEWARLNAILGEGDTLIITRLDRLARSTADLLEISKSFRERGVNLRCLEQPINTTTPEGVMFYTILGAFAEFELGIRKARQREGIEAAKVKGIYKGRPVTVDAAAIREAHETEKSVSKLARRFDVSRMTVYRALGEAAGLQAV